MPENSTREAPLEDLPERSRQVAEALQAAGVRPLVRRLDDSTRTAALAAEALGCEVGAIANSLVFMAGPTPVLVLTSGRHRVATKALAARLDLPRLDRADPDQVRAATGQAIGGVAPLGHPSPLTTVVDEALADYDRIWAAAGTPDTVFPTTHEELVRVTKGTSLPVAR